MPTPGLPSRSAGSSCQALRKEAEPACSFDPTTAEAGAGARGYATQLAVKGVDALKAGSGGRSSVSGAAAAALTLTL